MAFYRRASALYNQSLLSEGIGPFAIYIDLDAKLP